ncbi:MAG: FIST signal transduction protein [Gammaproteobacteria bacterium]
MDKFLSTYATCGEPNAEQICARIVAQLGAVLPPAANLGFLYVTDALADQAQQIVARLRNHTGVNHWVGSVGMGVCGVGQEFYDMPAAAVLIGAFPDNAFRVFSGVTDSLENFIAEFSPWYQDGAAHVAMVHGDPRNPEMPRLIHEFSQVLPGGFLVGGLTSSNARHIQIADQSVEGGLSGVIFNEQVEIITGLSQGCTPIGPRHLITECSHNIISRIDNRPALEVFNEDIGELLARDLNRVAGYIFVGLPIAGSDKADYLVRNLIGIDMLGKRLGIGDQVEVGQQLMFCRRDGLTAQHDLQRMLTDLTQRSGRPPRGAVYYSCVGRGRYLFGTQSEEVQIVRAALGDIPLAGFYANGEICHDRLYGFTGVLSLFL